MRLVIKRNQNEQKGILGGHKGMSFLLSCKVELTSAEQDLIAKYRADKQPLAYTTTKKGDDVPAVHIADLVRGISYELKDVVTLLSTEEDIKNACEAFKTILVVMESFGGEEIIEF